MRLLRLLLLFFFFEPQELSFTRDFEKKLPKFLESLVEICSQSDFFDSLNSRGAELENEGRRLVDTLGALIELLEASLHLCSDHLEFGLR